MTKTIDTDKLIENGAKLTTIKTNIDSIKTKIESANKDEVIDITKEIKFIEKQLNERDTKTTEKILNNIHQQISIVNTLDNQIEQLEAQIKPLKEQKKIKENIAENLLSTLYTIQDGRKTANVGQYTIKYTESEVCIVPDNADLVPKEYRKVTTTIDKAGIKKELKAGKTIENCYLDKNKHISLEIKE